MFQALKRHQLVSLNNFLGTSVNISKQQRVRVRLLKIQKKRLQVDLHWKQVERLHILIILD